MSEQLTTYGFSEAIQRKIVSMMLLDVGAFAQNAEIIKPEFFDSPVLANFVKIIIKFFDKYHRVPDRDEFVEELDSFLNKNSKLPMEEYLEMAGSVIEAEEGEKFDYVKDKVTDFVRYQAVKGAIIKSVDLLQEKRDFVGILNEVRSALTIGEGGKDLGSFYYEELESRLEERELGGDRSDLAIPTGLNDLDAELGGGLAPGEVGVLLGPMKRGKSMTAANFAKGALDKGHSVIHFGFEGSEPRTKAIYDASISGVPKFRTETEGGLKGRSEEVGQEVNKFFVSARQRSGADVKLVVKHFPARSASVWTLEAHLQKLRLTEGFNPALVIVDYLGLMKCGKGGKEDGRYEMFGDMVIELVSLAQRQGYAIWLLHQATRGSLKKKYVGMDDSADSIEPMRHVDIILTMSQTKEEAEMKPPVIRLCGVGGREIPDYWEVKFEYHKACCQIKPVRQEV